MPTAEVTAITAVPSITAVTAESDVQRPIGEVEADLVACAGRLAAGEAEFLRLLGEFDARSGWAGDGILSLEHWLAWRCGMARSTARDRIRVARALRGLPKTSAAMAAGEVSYSKVRAMARVATPATEDVLLQTAGECTAGQLERHVRAIRSCVTVEEDERRRRRGTDGATVPDEKPILAARPYGVRWHYDGAGDLVFTGRIASDQGADLLAALDAAAAVADAPAEAVVVSAETPGVLRSERTGRSSAATWHILAQAATRELVDRRGRPTLAPVAEVVVHVDAAELLELEIERDEARPSRRHLENGPSIGRDVLERLACDGGIRLETHGSDGRTLDLGRRRHPTGRMGKALLERDGGCRFPGCGRRRFLHAHHVHAWARGGLTRMNNMILLCGEHHRLLHRGAFTIEALGRQRFTFLTAEGAPIPDAPDLGTPSVSLAALYSHLAADAIVPSWDGGTLADQDLRIVRYLDAYEPLRTAAA